MTPYLPKILMVVENVFPGDVRVTQEAVTLTKNNYKVSVISLSANNQRKLDKWNDISVYRIPKLDISNKKTKYSNAHLKLLTSILAYSIEYCYFTLATFFVSALVLFREGFDVIHAHNPPDTIFTWVFIYKLIGKKFIYDQHDLAPEMYLAKYNRKKDFIYKCLLLAEKITSRIANIVISTNNSYREIEMRRNRIPSDKLYVVRNGPDLNSLSHYKDSKLEEGSNKVKLAYAGMINLQDGLDYLLRSIKILIYELNRKDICCYIFGSGDAYSDMKKYAKELKIDRWIRFRGFVKRSLLFKYLSKMDICLSPEPLNAYNNHSTFIKVMEYMALAKPIVAFDLKETRYSAQGAALYVTPNHEHGFAQAIEKLMDDPKLREKLGKYGRRRVEEELSWHHVSKNLIKAYGTTFDRKI